MKYMLLLNRTSDALPEAGNRRAQPDHPGIRGGDGGDGQGRRADRLRPAAAARRRHHGPGARRRDACLTDGQAAEIKEQFGGYTLIECAGLDEALPLGGDRARPRSTGRWRYGRWCRS